MEQSVRDVIDFHKALGLPLGNLPGDWISEGDARLRMRLVDEELNELHIAWEHDDIEGIADACADLIYVTIGAALSRGIDLRPVWREVQGTNMAKAGGPIREDGKRMKPEGWQPPDVAGILANQAPIE